LLAKFPLAAEIAQIIVSRQGRHDANAAGLAETLVGIRTRYRNVFYRASARELARRLCSMTHLARPHRFPLVKRPMSIDYKGRTAAAASPAALRSWPPTGIVLRARTKLASVALPAAGACREK